MADEKQVAQPVAVAEPVAAPVAVAEPTPVPVVTAQPAAPQVIVQQMVVDRNAPPANAPPGGHWSVVQFWGQNTTILCIVLILLFWPAVCCIGCCKCDQREVYTVNGMQYDRNGMIVTDCC